MENKVETLESQKEELASSMDESDYGTMVQREMMKIRKEGKMKEKKQLIKRQRRKLLNENTTTVLDFVASLLVCAFMLAVVIYSLPL